MERILTVYILFMKSSFLRITETRVNEIVKPIMLNNSIIITFASILSHGIYLALGNGKGKKGTLKGWKFTRQSLRFIQPNISNKTFLLVSGTEVAWNCRKTKLLWTKLPRGWKHCKMTDIWLFSRLDFQEIIF